MPIAKFELKTSCKLLAKFSSINLEISYQNEPQNQLVRLPDLNIFWYPERSVSEAIMIENNVFELKLAIRKLRSTSIFGTSPIDQFL